MSRKIWTIVAAGLAAGVLACGPEAGEPTMEETVVPEVEQAREEFTDRTEERLNALKEDMDELKGRIDDDEVAPEVRQRVEEWDLRYEDLEDRIENAADSELNDLQSWRQFESEINTGLNDLRASYETLSQQLGAAVE